MTATKDIAIRAKAYDIPGIVVDGNNVLEVYTKPENLENVKKGLEEQGIKIESFSLDLIAKEMVDLEEKDINATEKLFEALDENDATQEIYSNLK